MPKFQFELPEFGFYVTWQDKECIVFLIMLQNEVADQFSEVLGRKIEYVDEDPQAFRERVAPFMRSEWHLNAVCHLFSEIVAGVVPPEVTTTFQELVGREPISLKQFVQDFIFVFQD